MGAAVSEVILCPRADHVRVRMEEQRRLQLSGVHVLAGSRRQPGFAARGLPVVASREQRDMCAVDVRLASDVREDVVAAMAVDQNESGDSRPS